MRKHVFAICWMGIALGFLLAVMPAVASEVELESAYQRAHQMGDHEDAFRQSLAFFDGTPAPLAKSLLWGKRAADSADAAGRTRELLSRLSKLVDEQPTSAAPKLVLAQAVALLGDQQKATLLLKGVEDLPALADEELIELARLQEATGQWLEALPTLRKAENGGQSAAIQQRIAFWQLRYGGEKEALRIFAEQVAANQMEPKAAIEFLNVLCYRQQWARAASLMEPLLQNHPEHFQLRYLYSTCLEESDREKEAMASYEKVLQLTMNPPNPGVGFGESAPMFLPPELREIYRVANAMDAALDYHRGNWTYSINAEGEMQPAMVALTSTSSGTRSLALAHLRELARHGDAARRREVLAMMRAARVQNPELMLDLPIRRNGGMVLEDSVLKEAPTDPQRHALWLSSFEWRVPAREDLPALERCVSMFEKDQVMLAFLAAFSSARVEADGQVERQHRALELMKRMVKESPTQCQTTIQLVNTTRGWPEAAAWREAAIELFTQVRDTLPPMQAFQAPQYLLNHRDQAVTTLWELLLTAGRYEDCVRLLEEESRHLVPALRAMDPPQTMFYNGGGQPLIQAPDFPNFLVRWPSPILAACGLSIIYPSNEPTLDPAEVQRHHEGLAKASAKVTDPLLRMMLLRMGHPDQANAEMEKHLALPEASVADWITGAWMLDEKHEELSAERLVHAATMSKSLSPAAQRRLDGMMLTAVLSLKVRPDPLTKAAKEAALRLRDGPLTSQEAYEVVNVLRELGLNNESNELQNNIPPGNSWGWRRGGGFPNPLEIQQVPYPQMLDELQKSGRKNEAREIGLHYFQMAAGRISDQNSTPFRLEGEPEAVLQLVGPGADLVRSVAPDANATPHEQFTFAALCELTGQREEAIRHYQIAAEGLPWLVSPHVQMTLLHLLSGRVDAALDEFNRVPAESQPTVLWRLRSVLYDRNPSNNGANPETQRLAQEFLIRWFSRAKQDLHAISTYAVLPLTEILAARSPNDDTLLQAALAIPDVNQMALAILSRKVLDNGGDFTELAKHAQRILQEGPMRAMSPVQRLYRSEELSAFYPTPSLVLLWNAWQKNRPQDVEEVILPLARKTFPPGEVEALRRAAQLFFTPEENFAKAAGDFCKEPARDAQLLVLGTNASSFLDGGPVDLVVRVMRERKLHVWLGDFFASVLRGEPNTNQPLNAITRYLKASSWIKPDEKLAMLRTIRDGACGTPEERAEGFRIALQQRYTARRWNRGYRQVPVDRWLNWLESTSQEPELFAAALTIAEEDGLTSNMEWLQNMWGRSMRNDMNQDPAHVLGLLQASLMLEDAPKFRAWLVGPGSGNATQIERVVDSARSNMADGAKPLRELLTQRQPRTFGGDLVMLLLDAPAYNNDSVAPTIRFIQSHREAFKLIPTDRSREVLAALHSRLPAIEHPENLDKDTREALTPLLQEEGKRLEAQVEEVMRTRNWASAQIDEGRFPEIAQGIFSELSRKDEKRALTFATKVVAFIKESPTQIRQNEPPSGKTRTPSAYWLSRVSRTPHAYLLLQPLIASEGLADRSSWLSDVLLNIGSQPLKESSQALHFMEEMHFLDEAETFRTEPFSTGWNMTSAFAHAAQTLGYSPARQMVLNALKERQPQTFGTALLLVMLEKDREKARDAMRRFVRGRGSEFPRLTPSAALGVLAAIREAVPTMASSEQEPSLAPLVQPLLQQEEHWAMAQHDRLMTVRQWTDLDMPLNDLSRETVDVLRALANTHSAKAGALFLHLMTLAQEGVHAESQFDPPKYRSSGNAYTQWLKYCAGIPSLFGPVMKAAEEQPDLVIQTDWMSGVSSQLIDNGRLANPDTALALVKTLPFLKEAQEFRAYKVVGRAQGTMLGELMNRLNHYSDSRESGRAVLKLLQQHKPPTFGSELMLAMMRTDSSQAVAEFVKKRAADLAQMSSATQEEMAILFGHEIKGFEKPETLDAELRAAAAPILAKQQTLIDLRVAGILKASSISETHLTEAEFRESTPRLLQHLADTDLPTARRFLAKVTDLLSAEARTGWLMNCAVAPQLFPEVMVEAKKQGLLADDEKNWFINYMQSLTTRDNLKDATRLMGFLEATSLLKEAPQFDPISMVDRHYYFQTGLEAFAEGMRGIWADKKAVKELNEALAKRTPRTFGCDLLLVLLGEDPVANMATLVKTREKDWSQIEPQHQLAVAGLMRPILSRMEAARLPETAEVKRILQPILEVEASHERAYLQKLMAAEGLNALTTKHYLFQRHLTWLLEWMISTGEGDPKAALAKACQLYKATAKEAQNWDKQPSSSALAYLLHNLPYSPRLLELVMNEAATWKLADDSRFRSSVANAHSQLNTLWSGPTATRAILLTSHLLEDTNRFDVFAYQNNGPRSELEDLVPWMFSSLHADLRSSLLTWLQQQPKTLGMDYFCAALSENPEDTLPSFAQSHAEDLAKLPEAQRAAVQRLSQRLIKQQQQRLLKKAKAAKP